MRAAVLALALLLPACSAEPADPPDADPPPAAGPQVHLALGDSVAAGVGAPPDQGYAPLLTARLREECDCEVDLRNLAASGATTASLLRTQLPAAQEVLRGDDPVRAVTVTVGGNDVFVPVVAGCRVDPGSPACTEAVDTALASTGAGLGQVLGGLREAAGARVPIAVMTYYDPVPACDLAALAPLSARVLAGLNDVVREQAREAGAVVVETEGLLTPGDLVGGRDCLHPSPSGHRRIAAAFADALG